MLFMKTLEPCYSMIIFNPHNILWGFDLHAHSLSASPKAISWEARFLQRTMESHWTIAQKQVSHMTKEPRRKSTP